jgi:hypothetical protein
VLLASDLDEMSRHFGLSFTFPDFADDAVKDAPGLQVDTRFSRAAGGAFPSSLPKVRIDGSTEETWNSCFVRLTRQ